MPGNAWSHASGKPWGGSSRPPSTRDTTESSQPASLPSSAWDIPAASRARRTSAPKKCIGDVPGVRILFLGIRFPSVFLSGSAGARPGSVTSADLDHVLRVVIRTLLTVVPGWHGDYQNDAPGAH